MWPLVIVASLGAYWLKLSGFLIPARRLENPRIAAVIALLPIGLLAGLIVQQTLAESGALVIDGRLLGAGIAIFASIRKWPFILVIFVAAIATALARQTGIVA